MSTFSAAMDNVNEVMLATFGDTCEVTLSDETTLFVNGIFEGKRDDVEPNVAPGYRYTLTVKTVDVQGFNVAKRNTVTVNGVVYTIIDITPDDGGMTEWVLKRYG